MSGMVRIPSSVCRKESTPHNQKRGRDSCPCLLRRATTPRDGSNERGDAPKRARPSQVPFPSHKRGSFLRKRLLAQSANCAEPYGSYVSDDDSTSLAKALRFGDNLRGEFRKGKSAARFFGTPAKSVHELYETLHACCLWIWRALSGRHSFFACFLGLHHRLTNGRPLRGEHLHSSSKSVDNRR